MLSGETALIFKWRSALQANLTILTLCLKIGVICLNNKVSVVQSSTKIGTILHIPYHERIVFEEEEENRREEKVKRERKRMNSVVILTLWSVFMAGAACQLTCGNYPCVPGVENLGRGFDCVYGMVKEVNVVELDVSGSKRTYTNPYHGTVYGIPPTVAMANTPEYEIDSATFRSSVSFATTK
jgi:hypothetical protein